MKEKLIITDVTRMSGDRVCVGGITMNFECRRPVFTSSQISENWLYDDELEKCIVFPFEVVELDFLQHKPVPPHTEDWLIDPNYKQRVGTVTNSLEVLEQIAYPTVYKIFEARITKNNGYYIKKGNGVRSLGTVKANILDCYFGFYFGRLDYRINFEDVSGREYKLRVTDLSFQYFCRYLHNRENMSFEEISQHLNQKLCDATVYLRIGLTRPTWEKYPDRCFLHITGVYSFPDYLDGRCFADFYKPRLKATFISIE